ncbi:MAG: formimidoylglutamase [Mesonia hippocampi]|uniref:formimidoylglutamase n=1 Tax=Mesonia hippocampi TaxID=1628250 RepID=UPI003F9A7133
MTNLCLYSPTDLAKYVTPRAGETKLGEEIITLTDLNDLENHPAEYVIFGIPEDIGVRANYGKEGARSTWNDFLSSFLNIQKNKFNNPENCILLGHINTDAFIADAAKIQEPEKLGSIVDAIDDVVTEVVTKIVRANKIPIAIGGGHNNAYGIIKGTSLGLERSINVLNIDAHTDLRAINYRHSGNGFSFAKDRKYLAKYAVFGLHKNYTPTYIFDAMDTDNHIEYVLFEDMLHLSHLEKLVKYKKTSDFLDDYYGLEIDCDAIENFNSSAITPSGFSVTNIRGFLNVARKQDVVYLHICEAITSQNPSIAKSLSYFVSDFIRRNP